MGINPADAHRREMKKKAIKRNKNFRAMEREARAIVDDPDALKGHLQVSDATRERATPRTQRNPR